eukprot:CAMPEP_0114250662 /NCGR_PEP_ID=MMETSP0058-20121206/14826_1 /TAXON_ID=36894 /ORGANISM="Pyramimonas parkeae, CCMP726" /LENGTH=1027 /DNA_ID=CAMNT_0001364351 /DNA_START=561 /DNA_END=3644 /DNA_ORIENTATION=+
MDPDMGSDSSADLAVRRVEALQLAEHLMSLQATSSAAGRTVLGNMCGFCRKDTELCIVRPLYKRSLASLLNSLPERRLPASQLLQTACAIAFGLKEAHKHGLVVGHLNLENTCQDFDDSIVVCEAGISVLAARMGIILQAHEDNSHYASPEAVAAVRSGDLQSLRDLRPSSDVWSFACVVCELASGVPPFLHGTTTPGSPASACAHPPITDVHLPQHLVALLHQCLDPAEGARPSACALHAAFEGAVELMEHANVVQRAVQVVDTLDVEQAVRALGSANRLAESSITESGRLTVEWMGPRKPLPAAVSSTRAHVLTVLSTVASNTSTHAALVASGAVPLLLSLLRCPADAEPPPPGVMDRSLSILARLVASHHAEGALDAMAADGAGVASLVGALRARGGDRRAAARRRKAGLSVLAKLAGLGSAQCASIRSEGGVSVLLGLLQAGSAPVTAAVKENAVAALAELAHRDGEARELICKDESLVLEHLVATLVDEDGASTFATKLSAVRLVCGLASHRDSRARVVEAGGMRALLGLLRGEWLCQAQNDSWRTWTAVVDGAREPSRAACAAEAESGEASGVSRVHSMQTYSPVYVKALAVTSLAHLAAHDEAYCVQLVEAGGIPLLVAELQKDAGPELVGLWQHCYLRDEDIQNQSAPTRKPHACSMSAVAWNITATVSKALAVFAHCNAANRKAIAEANGIQALLDVMARRDAPLFMKGIVAATLTILAWEPENVSIIRESGGAQMIVSLLHESSSKRVPGDIRAVAATAVSSLVSDVHCRTLFGESNCIEALVATLNDERLTLVKKESAIHALSVFAGDGTYRGRFASLDTVPALCRLLACTDEENTHESGPDGAAGISLPPPGITKALVQCLDRLTEDPALLEELARTSGIHELLNTVTLDGPAESKLHAACLVQKLPKEAKSKKSSIQYLNNLRMMLPSIKSKLNLEALGMNLMPPSNNSGTSASSSEATSPLLDEQTSPGCAVPSVDKASRGTSVRMQYFHPACAYNSHAEIMARNSRSAIPIV